MIHTNINRLKRKVYQPSENTFIDTSEEARICLNCTLKRCICDNASSCKRYKEEIRKIKEKRKNGI